MISIIFLYEKGSSIRKTEIDPLEYSRGSISVFLILDPFSYRKIIEIIKIISAIIAKFLPKLVKLNIDNNTIIAILIWD